MFGFKKRDQSHQDSEKILAAISRLEQSVSETSASILAERLEVRQRKQENMLEEALELLDGCGENLETLNESQKSLVHQKEQEKQNLLEVIMLYGEYMEQLRQNMSKSEVSNSGWDRQWEVMEISLRRIREKAGVSMIMDDGEPADPERVQVVKQERTMDQEKHNYVHKTVVPGWLYKGIIIQKAKVIVYKYGEEQ